MNTIDDRITAALRAQAESLTQDDLSPAAPPVTRRAEPARARWTAPLLAAAVVGAVAVATVTVVEVNRDHHTGPATQPVPSQSATQPVPSQSATQPAPSQSATQPVPSATGTAPSTTVSPPAGSFTLGYQPLWPFSSYAEAERWRTTAGGSQPWHLDAGQTALSFTRSYLGFTELDQVAAPRLDGQGAHVGVGFRDPNGQLRISAVLHLVRYGGAKDSPWEVVGSDDTTLSLEQPAYGSQVSSPMIVGGHITGVDESIVVSVLRSTSSGTDRATMAGVPAGGDHAPWTTSVPFTQRGVLTIVASTGGHLQRVERFAIQGVHT